MQDFLMRFENPGITTFTHVACGQKCELNLQHLIRDNCTIILCPHCDVEFCYLCMSECTYEESNNGMCVFCEGEDVKSIGAFNRYFLRPGKTKYNCKEGLLRNYELTKDLVIKQLEDIVQQAEPCVVCSECGVGLHRTVDCNELTHCGKKICYFCGYQCTTFELDNNSHYCEDDCYQYMSCHPFLKHLYECNIECHSHSHPCTNEKHKNGIWQMHEFRKKRMVQARLESLSKPLLKEVLLELQSMNSTILSYIH